MEIAGYRIHPECAEYGWLAKADFEALQKDIETYGQKVPIDRVSGEIVDGKNRLKIISELGLEPTFRDLPADTDIPSHIESLNDRRRHESEKLRAKRIEERRARVLAAREEGKSLRTIAAEEGVSLGQVQKDIASTPDDEPDPSGVYRYTPEEISDPHSADHYVAPEPPPQEPPKVTGKDGKKYPAKKPTKPKVLCPACQENGTTKGCEACKTLRKKAKDAAAAPTPGDADESVITDAEGETVPEQARAAFVAAETIKVLCKDIRDIASRVEAVAKGPGGRLIRWESVKQQLEDARGTLDANRATHVCPYCHGKQQAKPCACCKGEGWTSRHIWGQAPGNNKKAKRA